MTATTPRAAAAAEIHGRAINELRHPRPVSSLLVLTS